MNCPRCNARKKVKNGKVLGKQRYKCKIRRYNYTTGYTWAKPKAVKRLALQMYLEGLGFESIGRVLGVSHVSVYKWVRQAGNQVKTLLDKKEKKVVKHMELDELWHYIDKKNANAGSGWLLIEVQKKLLGGSKVIVAKRQERNYGTR